MKFCYVDFAPDTNASDLFSHYRSTMSRLSEEHPHVRFLHTTVPLMTRPLGIKERTRLLLGMPVWEDDANAKRHEFNQLVRETYDSDLIIDVAGRSRLDWTGRDNNTRRTARPITASSQPTRWMVDISTTSEKGRSQQKWFG